MDESAYLPACLPPKSGRPHKEQSKARPLPGIPAQSQEAQP